MTTTTISSTTCSPAWHTRRTPDRPTDGALVAGFAELLGRPLIPWQRQLADVAGERRDDGRLAYRIVVVIVPRRAGKTLLMLTEALKATARTRLARALYIVHRRETGSAMVRDDWFPMLEQSPLSRRIQIRRANGSEAFAWKGRGSTMRLMPPDGGAARSFASDLVMIDEAREYTPDQGVEFEAGIWPTQATTDGQIWLVSNAGNASATWLAKYRDLGRAAVEGGQTDGVCFVEYAMPDGMDPDDPASWWYAHPGLGHHVRQEVLEQDHQLMDRDTFATEYLGLWPSTVDDGDLVGAWAKTIDDGAKPGSEVVFAVETSIDRDRTWIVAAGLDGDRVCVELVDDRPHGTWVASRLAQLCESHNPLAVTWDRGGPVAALTPTFDYGAAEAPLGTRDVAAACGWLLDSATSRGLVHRDDPVMSAAAAAAARRPAGGAWIYDRRHPAVGPILAAALACWTLADQTRGIPTIS